MDENAPSSVSAAAIDQGPRDIDTRIAAAPIPKKKTSIIARRPQRSPSRPEGTEPSPNMKNAPTLYGIRSSQRAKPNSCAIDTTAVAKISRNMWSIAWATLSSSAVPRGVSIGSYLLAAAASRSSSFSANRSVIPAM